MPSLMLSFVDAWRRIRRSPRLSVATVVCIALGMVAVATVSTLVALTTWQALPFPDAERLVRVWNYEPVEARRDELAWQDVLDLRGSLEGLDQVEATARSRLIFHLPGRTGRRVEGEAVSDGYFNLLGVAPMLGRGFTEEEMRRGEPVMLLSHATWAKEFQYADDILGRTVRTSFQSGDDSVSYTIVGVMPETFLGTIEDDIPDLEFWLPINSYMGRDSWERPFRNSLLLGRLAPGTTIPQVQAQADALARSLAPEYAELQEHHAFLVEPLGANWRDSFRAANGLMSAAAAILLLVASLNVALLLLARTLGARRHLAIRGALGASRLRLIAPIVVETVVLALMGGIIGAVAAGPVLRGFLGVADLQIPEYLNIAPDFQVLMIALGAIMMAGLLAAALPAWLGSRIDPRQALTQTSDKVAGAASAGRWSKWLVVLELALTVALLVVTLTLGRSFVEIKNAPLGFNPDQRLRVGLFINPADVAQEDDLARFIARVERRVLAIPGVRSVALVWPTAPIIDAIVGQLSGGGLGDDSIQVSNFIVGDRFFESLEVPLLAGRQFDDRDSAEGVSTAVISASLAQSFGGLAQALEREVELNGNPYRIVGVVGDARFGGPVEDAAHRHEMYLSLHQIPRRVVSLLVEVDGEPLAFVEPVKDTLAQVAPNSAVDWVEPMDQFVAWLYRDHTFRFAVVAAFGLSTLLLALVGLYALLAQQVAGATAEIGVRKALGATGVRLLGWIMWRGVRLAAMGVVLGLALSLLTARLLGGLLVGVETFDAVSWSLSAGILLTVAALACLWPARRAAQVEPMEAIRHE